MKLLYLAAAVFAAVTAVQASEGCKLTGFYAGLNLGAVRTRIQSEELEPYAEDVKERNTKSAVTYGLMAGYNYMFSSTFLIGAEASVQFGKKTLLSGISRTTEGVTGEITRKDTSSYTQETAFGLVARAGVVVNKNILLYVRLGVEHHKYTYKLSMTDGSGNPLPAMTINKSSGRVRANIGAGVEYYVANNVFVGGEYRYAFSQKLEGKNDTDTRKMKASQHFFLARVGYKF